MLNRMYDEFAHLWPLISAPEDYANEAGYWRAIHLAHAPCADEFGDLEYTETRAGGNCH